MHKFYLNLIKRLKIKKNYSYRKSRNIKIILNISGPQKMGLLFDSYILDVLVALGTLFIVFYMFYMSSSSYWKDRGIPYVEPSIFGGIYSLLGRKPFHELHMDIYNAQPDASVIGYFDLRDPALTIRDPTLVE